MFDFQKIRSKENGEKDFKKKKKRFKYNKLFLYTTSNSFYLF